jgi:hypothetical protein
VTRQEAEQRCAELARDDPDPGSHRWFPRETSDGSWTVVKVAAMGTRIDPLKATTQAKPQPEQPEDPPQPPQWGTF